MNATEARQQTSVRVKEINLSKKQEESRLKREQKSAISKRLTEYKTGKYYGLKDNIKHIDTRIKNCIQEGINRVCISPECKEDRACCINLEEEIGMPLLVAHYKSQGYDVKFKCAWSEDRYDGDGNYVTKDHYRPWLEISW